MKSKTSSSNRSQITIIDTFPDFEEFWKAYRARPIEAQIDSWVFEYMGKWPYFLENKSVNTKAKGQTGERLQNNASFQRCQAESEPCGWLEKGY